MPVEKAAEPGLWLELVSAPRWGLYTVYREKLYLLYI
jgi:hypothetical protein